MNCRLTHLYDMYWSSESRCTWMPHSLGHATGTYWHSPSTAPPCRCSSCLPSSPIHLQPSALLLQRTMRANTCFLKNKSSVVWSGDFFAKGARLPLVLQAVGHYTGEMLSATKVGFLWILKNFKRDWTEIFIWRFFKEVVRKRCK